MKNPKLETIRITREEYNDFCNMRNFIYDNNHVMSFEMYVEMVNFEKERILLLNDLDNEQPKLGE